MRVSLRVYMRCHPQSTAACSSSSSLQPPHGDMRLCAQQQLQHSTTLGAPTYLPINDQTLHFTNQLPNVALQTSHFNSFHKRHTFQRISHLTNQHHSKFSSHPSVSHPHSIIVTGSTFWFKYSERRTGCNPAPRSPRTSSAVLLPTSPWWLEMSLA